MGTLQKIVGAVLLVLMVILPSCNHIDLNKRSESVIPACLVVSSLPWSWQPSHVQEAAEMWNFTLDRRAFSVSPVCVASDNLVSLTFVLELPPDCGQRGCVRTLMRVDGVPDIEVYIHHHAPFSTIMHELGQLAGRQL